jgi:thiamine biosynthesis lipoprotein
LTEGAHSFRFDAMGSPCEVRLYAADHEHAARAARSAIGEVQRIEQAYSRYLTGNITCAMNAAARLGDSIEVDEETSRLLDIAFAAYDRSDGLFDITSGVLRTVWNDKRKSVPTRSEISAALRCVGLCKVEWRRPWLTFSEPGMQMDFGGIGKEFAADLAARKLVEHGIDSGVVDLGGDLTVIGPHPDGEPWRIGIRDPNRPDAAIATLFVERGGIASSGNYERFWELGGKRYGHILNPRTGWPVEGPLSVTVLADSCLEAGLTATIAMLKGEEGAAWLNTTSLPHLYIGANGALNGLDLDGVKRQKNSPSETAP